MFNPRNLFYFFIIGFCFGIALVEVSNVSIFALISVLVTSLSVIGFLILHSKFKNKALLYGAVSISVFVCAMSLGGIRINIFEKSKSTLPLNSYEGENIKLVGRVTEWINGKNLFVNVSHVVLSGEPVKVSNEKIVLTNVVGIFDYGDTLVVSGRLEKPKNIKYEDGKEFDYISYLKTKDVFHVISFAKINEQQKNNQVTLRSILYNIKSWFETNVQNVVREPESSLATGVTVSGKGALPKDVQEDFVNSGIIHIAVLSGYNIAIVIRAIIYSFGFLGRRSRTIIAGLGIILFVIMTGGTAPVVRSAIMASITLLGALSYNNVSQNRTLFGAMFLMILFNPYALLHDASFILSVLSTFAIINGVDFVKRYLNIVTERANLRQILSETLATQLFVLPYILFQIGRLSVISPITNILVLPFIPFIMLFTFIVGVIAFIPFVSLPFAWAATVLSGIVIWIAHILANIPFASFEIKYFPLWAMVLCYLIYFVFWYMFENKRNERMEKVGNTAEPY